MDFTSDKKSCNLYNLRNLFKDRERSKDRFLLLQKEHNELENHISGIILLTLQSKEVKS